MMSEADREIIIQAGFVIKGNAIRVYDEYDEYINVTAKVNKLLKLAKVAGKQEYIRSYDYGIGY